ncbi:MAG: NrfD/PsrC family molybdoenzyme membrane anchor subunit [Solirubrobacteraceae bacterium]
MSAGAGMSAATRPAQATRDSYYGQPIIKEPVWHPEIPWYLFTGGLAGASAGLAHLCERTGRPDLARRAWGTALLGVSVSPPLLISDLGVPTRFLNMLRMFKLTSPMSVGSWILAGAGTATGVSALSAFTGRFPRLARLAKPSAAALGMPLATYTGALISQTAVPVWHEARRELPVLFAAGAAASAGAAATMLAPIEEAGPARRLALIGCTAEIAISEAMEQRLGELAEPYAEGAAGAYSHVARGLTMGGSLLIAGAGRRRRSAAVAGGAMVLAGAVCERWAVFKAGFQSARDPRYTVAMQRLRATAGRSEGASRRVRGER